MNFLHPARLALLLGVVGLAAAYVAVLLRNRRAAARYAAPARQAGLVSTRRGPLARHGGPVLALVALAGLVVAIAQPTRAEAVAREQGVVVVAVDVSASMSATDIAPTRLDAAITGATSFVNGLPAGLHVGLVSFDKNARLVVAPTTERTQVTKAIANLSEGPGTAAGEGIATSLAAVRSVLSPTLLNSKADLPASIVLLSDGATTVGRSAEQGASEAAKARVPVTTISFGTTDGTVTIDGETLSVPADPQTMENVARITGAKSFTAGSADELKNVYDDITTSVGTTTEQRELTLGFLGFDLVLLLAAAGVTLATTGRLL